MAGAKSRRDKKRSDGRMKAWRDGEVLVEEKMCREEGGRVEVPGEIYDSVL